MKEILLYSAGLDSYFAREYLIYQGHNIKCIYYDINSKYSKQEVETIKKVIYDEPVIIYHNCINLKSVEQDSAFVPNRNFLLVLLAQAQYYDSCNKIWIGGTLSDRVDDNNKEVFDELSSFLSKVHKKTIEISSPFWGMYKTDVIKWFDRRRESKTHEISEELLNHTFSCYYPKDIKTEEFYYVGNMKWIYKTYECMECPACFRKSVELSSINIFRDFKNDKIIQKYEKEFKNLIIPTPRSSATIDYIYNLNRLHEK